MDDNNQNINKEESRNTEEENIAADNEERKNAQEVAGPSNSLLPGAIPKTTPVLQKTGLSKSEHNIRHIITANDVANALHSISVSNKANKKAVNLNLKDLQIPKYTEAKEKETTLTDVKKIMVTCFKNDIEANFEAAKVHISSVLKDEQQSESQVSKQPDVLIPVCLPNEVILTEPIRVHSSGTEKKKSGNFSDRSDYVLGQRDSLSSIGSNVCRICMTRGRERLISPCNCKGSLANVHLSCLERWLNQVGRNHCELCGYSYPAIRTPRYTVLQALRLWFGNPRNRSHLQSDCLIFWLLSTVTAGLLAVCIVGTQYFVIEGNKLGKHDLRKDEGISHRITETAMNFFMAIVLCGYSVTVYLLWKEHYVTWSRWRRANVNVRLLLTRD